LFGHFHNHEVHQIGHEKAQYGRELLPPKIDLGGHMMTDHRHNPPDSEDGETGDSREYEVAGRGRIVRSSTAQTILAVAFLIIVTLISFLGVVLIGDLVVPSQVTYWMIELIFALLCGGAGALVGGSAVVRSTLRIPGSPVHATLGGAISMIIVGFAVAYLARPPAEEQMYSLEIHDVPQSQSIGDVDYKVFVGAENNDPLLINRDQHSVTIKIPSRATMYKAKIAVYTTQKDHSTTFARCTLTFYTTESSGNRVAPNELVPERDLHFRVHLAHDYIDKVVRASIKTDRAIENEPCVEGVIETNKTQRTPLNGHFTVLPISAEARLSSLAHLSLLPPFSILTSDASIVDHREIVSDSSGRVDASPGSTAASQKAEAQPYTAPSAPGPTSTQSSADQVPASVDGRNVSPTKKELVDAYIRGDKVDLSPLFESWGEVANYVVDGFRSEFNNNSKFVGPYVDLISNALSVVDDGSFLPPTRRPNWDESQKPNRLARNNNVPGFESGDYKKIITLLCGKNSDGKRAAQRLLKLYPSDNFYQHLDSVLKHELDNCDRVFATEAAVFYFYNRIVEYDGTFALNKKSRDWIEGNYNDGLAWINQIVAKDQSYRIFNSMLDYAYGVVLWDHNDHVAALPHFDRMIEAIRLSNRAYPSNPQHIAIALRIINEPERSSKAAKTAIPYLDEPRAINNDHLVSGTMVSLFALPEKSSKPLGNVKPDTIARIYLRADTWDLLHAGDQIGWARRVVTNAAN
jgi:hypothetical protein